MTFSSEFSGSNELTSLQKQNIDAKLDSLNWQVIERPFGLKIWHDYDTTNRDSIIRQALDEDLTSHVYVVDGGANIAFLSYEKTHGTL